MRYVSPAVRRVLGYTPEEAIGKSALEFLHPRDKRETMEDFARLVQDPDMLWAREGRYRHRDGSWRFLDVIGQNRIDDSVVSGVVINARDVTERRRAEEALRRHMADLEARNEDLDAFAHTVAHDLKSPLGLIVGFAELLEEDCFAMPRQELQRYLHTIAKKGHEMDSIIDALLLLAKVRGMDAEVVPLDMASIVARARQRLSHMVKDYHAETILPDTWPVALGYGPWVEAVWVNYLSNAIKYGGRPPCVELGADVGQDAGLPEGWTRFWVRDNGPGLTEEEQNRLFAPFGQLNQAQMEGYGLGLSIVQRIMEKLGGEVGVESDVGGGSTFSFLLSWFDYEGGE
jgi:PAS domain S-box-containing protein